MVGGWVGGGWVVGWFRRWFEVSQRDKTTHAKTTYPQITHHKTPIQKPSIHKALMKKTPIHLEMFVVMSILFRGSNGGLFVHPLAQLLCLSQHLVQPSGSLKVRIPVVHLEKQLSVLVFEVGLWMDGVG